MTPEQTALCSHPAVRRRTAETIRDIAARRRKSPKQRAYLDRLTQWAREDVARWAAAERDSAGHVLVNPEQTGWLPADTPAGRLQTAVLEHHGRKGRDKAHGIALVEMTRALLQGDALRGYIAALVDSWDLSVLGGDEVLGLDGALVRAHRKGTLTKGLALRIMRFLPGIWKEDGKRVVSAGDYGYSYGVKLINRHGQRLIWWTSAPPETGIGEYDEDGYKVPPYSAMHILTSASVKMWGDERRVSRGRSYPGETRVRVRPITINGD